MESSTLLNSMFNPIYGILKSVAFPTKIGQRKDLNLIKLFKKYLLFAFKDNLHQM